jgi:hypothetical protein
MKLKQSQENLEVICKHAAITSNPSIVSCGKGLYRGRPHVALCARCAHRECRESVDVLTAMEVEKQIQLAQVRPPPPIQKPLQDWFDAVYLINLKRRPDRLKATYDMIDHGRWPFSRPIVWEAIDGEKLGVPSEFRQNCGAFGCRQSHVGVLQHCLTHDINSVLVLEDDIDIHAHFAERVKDFLNEVPSDWEGIMFGGQHVASPIHVKRGIGRATNCQRTHAYAARGNYLRALYHRWVNAPSHIDWLMAGWQHKFVVYTPDSWLIGQRGGHSDVTNRTKPVEWWTPLTGAEPVILLHAPLEVARQLHDYGFWGVGEKLFQFFDHAEPANVRAARLRQWIQKMQLECKGHGARICTIWHPNAQIELIRQCTNGPVIEIFANNIDEALREKPINKGEDGFIV